MGTHRPGAAVEAPLRLTEVRQRRSELYGRRTGRPLSVQQQALFQSLLPTIAVPAGAIDLQALFPGALDFAFEVGFGGGEHLAAQARAHPERGHIGCEPYINGQAKLLTHIHEGGLSNVRIHPEDARDVLARLPDASLSAAYVLFPDPWPKLRHHKRRFVQTESVKELARAIVSGGEFRLATDHMAYARWALIHLMGEPLFRWTAERASDWRQRPGDWPATRYEQKALAAGRPCVYLRFIRL